MSIKDLFGKGSNKIVTKQQVEKLVDEVESTDLIKENNTKNRKLVTRVDYSEPKNFAKYGSAEKYYEDSFNHILRSYPYDGSTAERLKWNNEASGLDRYLLENQYPTAVGHIYLNHEGAIGSVDDSGNKYYKTTNPQYITIKGGPNKDPSVSEGDEYELSKQFPPKGGRANVWDEDLFRASNLGINPKLGNTIEFWTKLDVDITADNSAICYFDLWNGKAHADADYVRFLVESLPQSTGDFSVTYRHGALGADRISLSISSETKAKLGTDWRTKWHQFSISVISTAAGIEAKLFVNGAFEAKAVSGTQITTDPNQIGYIANINALRTKPVSLSPDVPSGQGAAGGIYFDEFRFWKSRRSAKEIGRHWMTAVTGGTNTDNTKHDSVNLVSLGVYYKFNEGILNSSQDATVLDYSGRISNGTIQNYSTNVRKLTSAMDESDYITSHKEKPDPIMYPLHPDVLSRKSALTQQGNSWDMENNASFYHTMPEWILDEDQEGTKVKELVQTLSSYLDDLHAQIDALATAKENKYFDLSDDQQKPYFFAKNLLRSTGFDVADIFTEATSLEEIASRGERELFDLRIQEIKNVIYQNIYNNISFIYKSKGTEKSFRNLIRCFGVDDELIKLNLYADGVDYTLEGRYSYSSVKKNYVDFNNVDREEGCVYVRDVSPTSSDERGYIAGMTTDQSKQLSITLTAEVLFPRQLEREQPAYWTKDFVTVSLFGTKEANIALAPAYYNDDAGGGSAVNNIGRFQVQAIRPDEESLHAKFKLIYTDADGDHELVSDEYKDVYDNTKWNFAVRLTPVDNDLGDYVSGGATVGEYKLEFYGVQMSLDVVENEFLRSASYTGATAVAKAQAMIATPKIVYCGHYRSNFDSVMSGTVKSDVKITDIMYWFDYLSNEEIQIHGKDIANTGRLHPNDDAYAFFSELSSGGNAASALPDIKVPRQDTLALHWDFTNVTTSDASSEFVVNDLSLGGANYIAENRYGWFTDLVGYRHQGVGSFNPAIPNDNQVINREYQYTAKHRLPEVLAGDDMVEIRTQDDNVFTKDSKPINHFFAIEKSMSQVISEEMINLFASIIEFNDLLGQPVHRYRMEYKSLQKLRALFYERIDNVPSFEKYVEFYKWLDSSLGLMMQQLIPASGNFSDSMRNMVESHILERNKYWTKFPTLEMKQDPPEGTFRGVRELTYDWEHGHAPVGVPVNTRAISFDASSGSGVLVEDSIERYRFSVDETARPDNMVPGEGDEPFTISAWVYLDGAIPPSQGYSNIVAKVKATHSQREYWLFARDTGQFGFGLYDDWSGTGKQLRIFTPGGSPYATDQWIHIVATYGANFTFQAEDGDPNTMEAITSGDMKIYINGVDSGGAPFHFDQGLENYEAMPANQDNFSSLMFGNSHITNFPFNGRIADVAIFNKHFTAEEAAECYGAGTVIQMSEHSASANLIGWWKMGDDLDTTGTGGLKNYAVDASPATLFNGAAIVDVGFDELPTQYVIEEEEHCLWRNERAIRSDNLVTSSDAIVDADRESIRKSAVRDILGQNKMVPVGTDGFVEEGEPTLYDIATAAHYEGSTYATRRLSRPYKLNLQKTLSVKGGPNFADATMASPNDVLRASTHLNNKIELSRLTDDAETCRDDYSITNGAEDKKRRAHVVTLTNLSAVQTEVKGSLFVPPFYGAYPNDASATQTNVTHDSYGQDHEIPMQGVFPAEWVGGNQHRHVDLNKGADDSTNRPELYVESGGGPLVHPFANNVNSPTARYTRDAHAKRPLNIANINTKINEDNYESYTGSPKLGNYERDYEIIQTSGRSVNNRWLVKDEGKYSFASVASPYVAGPAGSNTQLFDFVLPDRTQNHAGGAFGRTEHVFVERFSAPGDASVLSRGALDIQAEEFSPYNSLNFRNLRVRNHLNFWHKEHTAQFGYREDYIHGTYEDYIDANNNDSEDAGESNDFGGNTPDVAAWHKNNRNPITRMYLHNDTTVEAEKSYDNFYIGHQIPRSVWQYHWVTSSAEHFQDPAAGRVVTIGGRNPKFDDENRDHQAAGDPTNFAAGYDHDGEGATAALKTHPRFSRFITDYPNATTELNQVASAKYQVTVTNRLSGDAPTSQDLEFDFSYGNYVMAQPISWAENLYGSCGDCEGFFRPFNDFIGTVTTTPEKRSELNALLLNQNGPYQAAGWKFIKNAENPIVRKQRQLNTYSIQDRPSGLKEYVLTKPALKAEAIIKINYMPSTLALTFHNVDGWTNADGYGDLFTYTNVQLAFLGTPAALATDIADKINRNMRLARQRTATLGVPMWTELSAESDPSSNVVYIRTGLASEGSNNILIKHDGVGDVRPSINEAPTELSAVVFMATRNRDTGEQYSPRVWTGDVAPNFAATDTKASTLVQVGDNATALRLHEKTFTLTDAEGVSQKFTFDKDSAVKNATIGLQGVGNTQSIVEAIRDSINAITNLQITAGATRHEAVGQYRLLHLMQDIAGKVGETAVTDYMPHEDLYFHYDGNFDRRLQYVKADATGKWASFAGGRDKEVTTFQYNDRRSDSHQKFVEPPAAWNKPMVHIISEKNDNLGTRVVHSYSNNLNLFANPKLLRRTVGSAKDTTQFYDRLFERYSPTEREESTLDFVRLDYKEYIFPKHRNVGLLKTRSRVNWDALPSIDVIMRPTGDLRCFWKDAELDRIKGDLTSTVNAVGYRSKISQPYLFAANPTESIPTFNRMLLGPYQAYEHREWMQTISVFSMDNFEILDLALSKETNKWQSWRVLGDLQYIGLPTYLSWIVNQNCQAASSVRNVFLEGEAVAQGTVGLEIAQQIGDIARAANNNLDPTLARTLLGDYSVGAPRFLGGSSDESDDAVRGLSPASTVLGAWQISNPGIDFESQMEDIQRGSELDESRSNPGLAMDSILWYAGGRLLKTVLTQDSRCVSPTPTTQLYYLPWDYERPEHAWEYRTNIMSGKSPWYDSYKDFSLETKSMAQNYGIVAEFRVSSHMDMYLNEQDGNFRAKNYNFLTLDGASYHTSTPVQEFGSRSLPETQTSGKITELESRRYYSINDKAEGEVSGFVHIDDRDIIPLLMSRTPESTNGLTTEQATILKDWHVLTNNLRFSGFTVASVRGERYGRWRRNRNTGYLRHMEATKTFGNVTVECRDWEEIQLEFEFANNIYSGGQLKIENCISTRFPGGGDISASNPFTGKNTWSDSEEITDETGRHKYHSVGEALPDDVDKTLYMGPNSAPEEDDRYGYNAYDSPYVNADDAPENWQWNTWAPLTGNNPDTFTFPYEKPSINYREPSQFTKWEAITPKHRGEPAAVRLNRGGNKDEYFVGEVNLMARETKHAWWDKKVVSIDPFSLMESVTIQDGGLVPQLHRSAARGVGIMAEDDDGGIPPLDGSAPNQAEGVSITWQELIMKTPRDELQGGTPLTISIWARPERYTACQDTSKPQGLYVFGSYFKSSPVGLLPSGLKKRPAQWRDLRTPIGSFGLCANFPPPSDYLSVYPQGMGVTFFMPSDADLNGAFAGDIASMHKAKKGTAAEEVENYSNENVYHFFSKETVINNETGASEVITKPAILSPEEWNSVILQILPMTENTTPRIKLIVNGKPLLGIHRSAIFDSQSSKVAYESCPIGDTHPSDDQRYSPWGDRHYGRAMVVTERTPVSIIPARKEDQKHMTCNTYKLGKSVFADIEDNVDRHAIGEYAYFNGDLMEFSIWSGIFSNFDLSNLVTNPANLQELVANGEMLGGYTTLAKFQSEFGQTAPSSQITGRWVNSTSSADNWSRSTPSISVESTRSRRWLAAWHRLGVLPKTEASQPCHDWDDEFFNSYVHTDTVQFFDAIVEDHDSVSDQIRKRVKLKVNALKKLVPYRGFYPQDRTLQLADLFSQKMQQSIKGTESEISHKSSAMQAALQPFFAPGILYNSIKAGVAVDWPIFTNETGLEPTRPASSVELPFFSEDLGIAENYTTGNKVILSSIAPNWYAPRKDKFDTSEGLFLEPQTDPAAWTDDAKIAQALQERSDGTVRRSKGRGFKIADTPSSRIPFEGLVALDSVLPSATSQESEFADALESRRSFKYVDIEISAWDAEGTTINIWQPETLSTEEQYRMYNSFSHPDQESRLEDRWRMVKKAISIGHGDPTFSFSQVHDIDQSGYRAFSPSGAEYPTTNLDVEVNFRRKPLTFELPEVQAEDSPADYGSVSADSLNEELAVKICRAINKRDDIHWVAIPGLLHEWQYVSHDFVQQEAGQARDVLRGDQGNAMQGNVNIKEAKWTDDHIARLFPAAYPRVFDVDQRDMDFYVGDGITPASSWQTIADLGAEEDGFVGIARDRHRFSQYFNDENHPQAWSGGKPGVPYVGKQPNGTWRIRLVYVGPPRMDLTDTRGTSDILLKPKVVSEDSTVHGKPESWQTPTQWQEVFDDGGSVSSANWLWKRGQGVNGRADTSYYNCSVEKASNEGHPAFFAYLETDTPNLFGKQTLKKLTWKELHLTMPMILPLEFLGLELSEEYNDVDYWTRALESFEGGRVEGDEELAEQREDLVDELNRLDWVTRSLPGPQLIGNFASEEAAQQSYYTFEPFIAENSYACQLLNWVDTTGKPRGYFQGGAAKAMKNRKNITFSDLASVAVTREVSTAVQESRWVDGWGWFGEPTYSDPTKLGLRIVNSEGITVKAHTYSPVISTSLIDHQNSYRLPWLADIEMGFESDSNYSLVETSALTQGPYPLYGGSESVSTVRVTPKPHQIYLMTPEYYIGNRANPIGGGPENQTWAASHWNYAYPYFEYLGSNGDERFELAMNNFLAEVPNFFLKNSKLISFSSRPEAEFKTMEAGKTYFMDVTMYQSERFATVLNPYSDAQLLGSPLAASQVPVTGEDGFNRLTYEGSYYGPSFMITANDELEIRGDSVPRRADPCQAPYVPPYLYGKSVARISFYASEDKKYTLEEIFAGAAVQNVSTELEDRITNIKTQYGIGSIESPAFKARTTLSASMNLFGKSSIKRVEYSAQVDRLRDNLDSSMQKFVPQVAIDPETSNRDVWVIGTKFECPILNFYNSNSLMAIDKLNEDVSTMLRRVNTAIQAPSMDRINGRVLPADYNMSIYRISEEGTASKGSDSHKIPATVSSNFRLGTVLKDDQFKRGTGIWASYGSIPQRDEGVFVTLEETLKQREDFSTPKGELVGSLIDVCGFTPEKQKVGEIAEYKEISEAVVMIPFVDKPSETTAETVVVDGRNFFKINKELFDLQKANIENGKSAVLAGEYEGVLQDIEETSISRMIKSMKKYNLPPRLDFVKYPLKDSESPFVMYIFEFHHKLTRQDLADIWQGVPPELTYTAEYDQSTFMHDLSPVDFFEENTLPKNVRWMTFKVKKRAKDDYFETTTTDSGDSRFQFNFELGKTKHKYNYNWPYDYFTMLEMIQVEAGVDIVMNQETIIPQVISQQTDIKSSQMQRQLAAVKESSTVDTGESESKWGSAMTSDVESD